MTDRPKNLGLAGRTLWKRVTDSYQLLPDETRILEDACREADLIDRLESELRKPGVLLEVRGSKGQRRAHPLLAEVRAHRVTLDRLLRSVGLQEADDGGQQGALFDVSGTRSSKARKAAEARWRHA